MKKTQTILLSAIVFLWTSMAYAVNLPGPLVETEWLAKNLDDVVILDVRKDVKSFSKKPLFKKDKKTGKSKLKKVAGHIPNSILVNYKNLRTKKKIDGREVQKMRVGKADFEKLLQKSGVNKDSTVVIVYKGVDRKSVV